MTEKARIKALKEMVILHKIRYGAYQTITLERFRILTAICLN